MTATYETRVQAEIDNGLTRSDAQCVVDAAAYAAYAAAAAAVDAADAYAAYAAAADAAAAERKIQADKVREVIRNPWR